MLDRPQTERATAGKAREIVQRVFRGYTGSLAVRFWDGATVALGNGTPAATLVFHDAGPLRELILFRDSLRLVEAYFHGSVSVEGDLYAALRQKGYLQSLRLSAPERFSLLAAALLLGTGSDNSRVRGGSVRQSTSWRPQFSRRHSKAGDCRAVTYHYDASDDFYRLWLDQEMVYSCAYFEDAEQSLDQAQRNKLDHICRKLRLKPRERLLDIGCGWGALIRWAARHYGVQAYGITLSRNQYEHNQGMIQDEGLQERVTVELKDYRDLEGEAVFDKVVSVGMFEHVGLKNLPLYFHMAHRLLKPGGLFLNHGITHDREGWHRTAGTRFINRYVFPNGELDTVSNVQREMERSRFEILDVEALRPHYALTLRHWVKRLERRRDEALKHVGEATYRVWRLYMAACALQFEEGAVCVYQILAANRGRGLPPVPLTRRDIYG